MSFPGWCTLDAQALVELHEPRSLAELNACMENYLLRLLPDASIAVLIDDCGRSDWSVELVRGGGCPLRVATRSPRDGWQCEGLQHHALAFRGLPIGEMLVLQTGEPYDQPSFDALLAHYAAALATLKLEAASLTLVDHYCAGLQAFEEGVVLFQEKNRDVTAARFLQLATNLLGVNHAALLAFARVGDQASELRVDQLLGVPEMLIDAMVAANGADWPRIKIDDPPTLYRRDSADFPFASPGPGDVVHTVVTCPLRYHGITAGIALLFNVEPDEGSLDLKLSTLRRLGELGAALLHRLQLEGEAIFAKELETQLAIAATIQARLLPAEPPRNRKWTCAWSSRPSQSIGGDYLDLFDGPGESILAIIADVSGHGINSALLATSARAHFRALAPRTSPAEAMMRLNQELHREVGATGMFVTGVALSLAADGRSMRLASAGHNPVFVYRASSRHIEAIGASGPPLGFVAAVDYENAECELAPGDIVLLYSDGLTEATNASEEMFGEDRMTERLLAHAGSDPEAIMASILAAVDDFTGRVGCLSDDASIAVIKVAD